MRASLLLVLVAGVLLTGCSSMSAKDVLRTTQSAVNAKNIYGNSTVKEEINYRIRVWAGQ
jgi:outer membrane murein-binding lipoprotein Lpp